MKRSCRLFVHKHLKRIDYNASSLESLLESLSTLRRSDFFNSLPCNAVFLVSTSLSEELSSELSSELSALFAVFASVFAPVFDSVFTVVFGVLSVAFVDVS